MVNDSTCKVDQLHADAVSPYRMPAEWEPVAAVWVAWPHNPNTWPGRLDRLPAFYRRWIESLAASTPVRVLAGGSQRACAAAAVGDLAGVEIVEIETNDCWVRDFGPTFVIARADRAVCGIDWKYNAWGGKYPPWDLDEVAASEMCDRLRIPRVSSDLCLEGGALETDGRGRMIVNPHCVVCDSRNPGWTADDVAQAFYRYLGVEEVVWVDGGGLQGDDTGGHIDQLARFIDPEHVVVAVASDRRDPNHLPLEDNFRQLRLWGQMTEPRVEVHRLPIPPARMVEGQRVPESYCNFLRLGAERILVPTFAADSDQPALGLLSELSGAEVTGIDCRELVWGLGALHCASREQPA